VIGALNNAGSILRGLAPIGQGIKKRASKLFVAGRQQQRKDVMCQHERRKQNCLECGTASLCQHNKRKAFCRSV
jgi:hypothetical protein